MSQRFVEFPGDLGTLRGVWDEQDSASVSTQISAPARMFPAVILLHGFTGSHTESQFLFVETARRLAKAGIAALRADFYGSGDSDGSFQDMTIPTELADARRMFAFAAMQAGVDPTRVGVLGYSLGGCIAGLLAGSEPRLGALVLWAPAATLNMSTWLDAQPQPPAVGGLVLNSAFAQSCREAKPLQALAGFDRPTLVLHGDQDGTVPLADGAAFADKVGGRLQVIEGADHGFSHPEWREALIGATIGHFADTLRA